MDEQITANGNKTILGIPCGCGGRQEILGSGDWQKDLIVLLVLIGVPTGIYLYMKYYKISE